LNILEWDGGQMEIRMLEAAIGAVLAAGLWAGWRLFDRKLLRAPADASPDVSRKTVSVVIPARNEAANLPHLLESLRGQTLPPAEIVVVDDGSGDGTGEIAARLGAKVIRHDELPPGWTGKNWALWDGFLHTTGEIVVFLDADVRLAPQGLEALASARERAGGVISVVPYHIAPRMVERLTLVFNILGIFVFMSPYEAGNPQQGLYGPCIVTSREDYLRAGGHAGIRSLVIDDLALGARYKAAGIPLVNYLGGSLVSYRMYPGGIRQAAEGFAKSAVPSMAVLNRMTVFLCALWMIGMFLTGLFFWMDWVLAAGLVLYAAQLYRMARHAGTFGLLMPVLHVLPALFFAGVMLYSVYQTAWLGRVSWKGRKIRLESRRDA
jgi:glycosyltransferase involved in cell wall biosynthesis